MAGRSWRGDDQMTDDTLPGVHPASDDALGIEAAPTSETPLAAGPSSPSLSPEVQNGIYRRLGAVALACSGAYLAAYGLLATRLLFGDGVSLLLYTLVTIPVLICAGIAIFGSRIVYQLTRALSRAQQPGGYRLVEKIGAGGMGEVWRANHQMLLRPAAVKLIRPQVLGGSDRARVRDAVRRFEREAQATARLRSPHSVELYDFGVTKDGTFYY